jgi:hypothetical protein
LGLPVFWISGSKIEEGWHVMSVQLKTNVKTTMREPFADEAFAPIALTTGQIPLAGALFKVCPQLAVHQV